MKIHGSLPPIQLPVTVYTDRVPIVAGSSGVQQNFEGRRKEHSEAVKGGLLGRGNSEHLAPVIPSSEKG